jgi:hypothetical protein
MFEISAAYTLAAVQNFEIEKAEWFKPQIYRISSWCSLNM